jgi:hypothetical protein
LALRDEPGLRTQSDGEGRDRSVVLYPADFKSNSAKPARRTLS